MRICARFKLIIALILTAAQCSFAVGFVLSEEKQSIAADKSCCCGQVSNDLEFFDSIADLLAMAEDFSDDSAQFCDDSSCDDESSDGCACVLQAPLTKEPIPMLIPIRSIENSSLNILYVLPLNTGNFCDIFAQKTYVSYFSQQFIFYESPHLSPNIGRAPPA